MTVRRMILVVLGFGAATFAVQLAGLGDLGGLMALIHLTGLIGAPLALILNRHVRSTPAVLALAVALSVAQSALAVQVLVWFSVATRLALIATATLYSAGIAWLLSSETVAEPVGRS